MLGLLLAFGSPAARSADVPGGVVINEIMAAAHYTIADEDGEYPDWIELRNTGAASVNLAGWRLTDDATNLNKWVFPAVEIPAGGYLLVFASAKDRRPLDGPLHTNFGLDQDGEDLALVRPDGTIADQLAPYPAQIPDVSCDHEGRFLAKPTPGAANATDFLAVTTAPVLDQPHGFKTAAFSLTMRCETQGAKIRYTLDGSTPTEATGLLYSKPIPIKRTTVVRAIAVKDPQQPSPVVTRTYLFAGDIGNQSPTGKAPEGWPKKWGENRVDYGMDPQVLNAPGVRRGLPNDLKSIPSMSLVMDLGDLFSADHGIYANPFQKGDEWERAMSLEWIDPDGKPGFQVNGGVRIRGGASRGTDNPKHSFHFVFRRAYGAAELEFPVFGDGGARRFDKFDLRCAQTNSWQFWVDPKTDFIRDQFARDTQADMGHPYTRGSYFHLYINGQYWGLYNTQEKSDASYCASYYSGSAADYDWIKYDNDGGQTMASDGTFAAWRRFCEAGAKGFTDNADYFRVQGLNPDGSRNPAYQRLLDEDNLIDYMVLGYYAGAMDNPHGGGGQNNWSGIRSRKGDFGFRFFAHDFEFSLADKGDDLLSRVPVDVREIFSTPENANPYHFWETLRLNDEFRLHVADRLQKHFFGAGSLTPTAAAERFKVRMREIDRAVVGESARWGDGSPERKNNPFRREDWLAACNEHLLQDYFPARSAIVLQQFRDANLYPNLAAPVFSPAETSLPAGGPVTLTNPDERGEIYYTTDGSDPRKIGGAVSSTAKLYAGPIDSSAFVRGTVIRARVKEGGLWSALAEMEYVPGVDFSALRVTEIHYAPTGVGAVSGDEYEFLELQNIGNVPLDLSGFRFTAGISFTFPDGSIVAPGAYLVLVRNAAKFGEVHPGVAVAGVYTGKLDNSGETLTLATAAGVPVLSMSYDVTAPWPMAANALGHSLVFAGGRNQSKAENWRASAQLGGSPGMADPAAPVFPQVAVSEIVSRPSSGAQAVELQNLGSAAADISHWWLTNDLANPRKYRIPAGTVIGPKGYVVFTADQFGSSAGPEGTLNFAATGDGVWLISADAGGVMTGYVEGFAYGATRPGESTERWVNADGIVRHPVASVATLGGVNARPATAGVRINEIQARPPAGDVEWVEIKNTTLAPVGVGGWKLDGFGLAFPVGAEIPGFGTALVVSGDPAVFRSNHKIPEGVQIFGPATGTLQDDGEEIALLQPSDLAVGAFVTIERVRYNDRSPWPVWPAEAGYSLQRIAAADYADESLAWLAGRPSPGAETQLAAPPRVKLVEPASGATFTWPGPVKLKAEASDLDGAIKSVAFLVDGAEVGQVTAAPWEFLWRGGSDGLHDITARVSDDKGATSESESVSVRIDEPDTGLGDGLKAEYYAGGDLAGEPIVRIDAQVDLHWSGTPPIAGLPKGPVSIRWTGQFFSRATGEYRFIVRADGGVRIWVDDQLLVSDWQDRGQIDFEALVTLEAGALHTLRLEYLDSDGKGLIQLLRAEPWSGDLSLLRQDELYTPDQDPYALGISTPHLLPGATRGATYRTVLKALHSSGATSWEWQSLDAGVFPAGLVFHGDGVITGIPEEGGEYHLRATVTDAANATAQREFILRVDDRDYASKPRVVLSSPAQNAKLLEGHVNLAGTVKVAAGRQVSEVLASINLGPWRTVGNEARWSTALSERDGLVPLANSIRVKARDNLGQESATVFCSFSQRVLRPLTVEISGKGTVTAGFAPTSQREIGKRYTITATPAPGWFFIGWNGASFSSRPTTSFVMSTRLDERTLGATFLEDFVPKRSGNYAGLLASSDPLEFGARGAATFTLSKGGAFTASVRFGGESFAVKGKLDRTGAYYTSLRGRDGETDYNFAFNLDPNATPGQVMLGVYWGRGDIGLESTGTLGRAVYSASKPFPGAGKYTLILPHGEVPAPQGDGYGLVAIDRAGRVTASGELGDGTPWTASAPLTSLGGAPLHTVLYTGTGTITGVLIPPSDTAPLKNDWAWLREAHYEGPGLAPGFSIAIEARTSRYTPPAAGTRAVDLSAVGLTLTGGGFADPIIESGVLSDANTFSFTTAHLPALQLQINSASGLATGSFEHPETHATITLRGAVEQGSKSLHGFFIGLGSGSLDLHAAP